MLKVYLPLTIACLVFGSSANAATLNLVTNGGFEIGEVQDGKPVFQGWNSPGGTFLQTDNGVNSGNFAAEAVFQRRITELSQTLATTAGTEYELSFFFVIATVFNNDDDLFGVDINGDLIFSSRPENIDFQTGNYTDITRRFTAGSNSTELRFRSILPNGVILLDDVSVTAVPVPFEFSPLLGATIFGGLWFGKRLIKPKK
jgi:hypothetical protein